MDDDRSVSECVVAAANGDPYAWDNLVRRYSPLLSAVIGRYALPHAARQDVAQIVWLRLVEHLGSLRDPRGLPKWLVTTARREALAQLRAQTRVQAHDPLASGWAEGRVGVFDARIPDPPDADLLRQERHDGLLAGLAELPEHQRSLLILLMSDPPLSYAAIARQLGIPIGAIGPTRARALARLRRSEAVQALADVLHSDVEGCQA